MNFRTGNSVQAPPSGTRSASLDGLRGLAVLSVVMFHTLRVKGEFGLFGAFWGRFQNSTWAGVDLFFVLSGFLITGILLDTRSQNHYFRNFYARRTLRIFPLYYAVLVVALFVIPAAAGLSHLPAMYPRLLANQLWLWTYTQNYLQATGAHALPGLGHFWSLAVEEQFYWFWPLAVYLLSRERLLQLCLMLCAILPLVRLELVLFGESTWAVRQYTHTRFDTLLYGAIVAIVVRDSKLFERFRRPATVACVTASVVLAVIALQDGYVPYESTETAFFGYSAFGIVFAFLIAYLVTKRSRLSDLLSAGSLRWFGAYSYGIYVFHWPVAQAVQGAIERRLLPFHSEVLTVCCYFSVVLAASSAAAWCTWNGFERHFLAYKRYFEYSPVKEVEPTDLAKTVSPTHPARRMSRP